MLILTILTDNHANPSERAFALPDHGVVSLEGPDAVAFAQAQFANDLHALEDGRWQWNAWLTPKGRVIAVFALLRLTTDRLLLVVPDVPAIELATALKRFVFRKKVSVTLPADLHPQGVLAAPSVARGALLAQDDGCIAMDLGGAPHARTLLLANAAGDQDEAALEHWRDLDLLYGLPRLDASQREQWTPQQLSLERLRAFSVRKGCYPGQEIVARTHFLGKAKRGLALLESDVLLQPGAPVADAERDLGQVVCASHRAPGPVLAILPLEQPSTALRSGDVPLHQRRLLDGLER